MAHTVALFFLLHPSLCLSFLSLFLVSVTASDSGWQPPGFLKANITAKDELQVCQTCKHALITHFSSGWQWGHWNNCCFFLDSTLYSKWERQAYGCCYVPLNMQFIQNNLASTNEQRFPVTEQHVLPAVAVKMLAGFCFVNCSQGVTELCMCLLSFLDCKQSLSFYLKLSPKWIILSWKQDLLHFSEEKQLQGLN